MMDNNYIVKARKHHGSDSLDITIPAKLRRQMEINVGDVFVVTYKKEGDSLILEYERIFQSR